MTTLAVCSALIGLGLGIRFRFFVLLPFLALGAIGLIVLAIVQDWPLAQTMWSLIAYGVPLQIGFAISGLVRHAMGPAIVDGRAARPESPKLR